MPRFVFEQFCLDTERRALLRGGEPVRLTPRAFRLLELLVRQRPKAMSKRELLEQVWAGTIVEEANLKTLVLEIRTALEDRGGDPAVIRTVYGFGYSFAGAAAESAAPEETTAPAALLVRWPDNVRTLPQGSFLIGRRPDCPIAIDLPSVSRVHARLLVAPRQMSIEDLHSKNGTFVDGRRISAPAELLPRCKVRVGDVDLELTRLDVGTDSTQTVG